MLIKFNFTKIILFCSELTSLDNEAADNFLDRTQS